MKGLRRTRAALATVAALAVEAAAIVGLGALGARREFAIPFAHVDDWLRVTPPADALAAVLRWVALLGAGWLCLGTLLYVVAAATRLRDDPVLQERAERLVDSGVGSVVAHFQDELASLVSGTIARWDADETSRRLELLLGPDLQFIRINGTIVGALAGLGIHAIAQVL